MENIYHRYLNLPFEIEPPLSFISLYAKKPDLRRFPGCYDDKVQDFHESLGLDVLETTLVYTPPNSNFPVHSDDYNIGDRFVKLNISWGGSKDSRICFWHAKKTYKHEPENLKDVNYPLEQANKKDCIFMWSANAGHPGIFNSSRLHSVYNPGNQGRWTAAFLIGLNSLKLTPDEKLIDWYTALEYYKEYLV